MNDTQKIQQQSQNSNNKTPNEQEKRINLDTIKLWLHTNGYENVDSTIIKSLSDDLAYRIRELLNSAINIMQHSKRTKLKTKDLEMAFEMLNIEKQFGYSQDSFYDYKKVDLNNNKKLNICKNVFQIESKLIELKIPDERTVANYGLPRLNTNWTVVNGLKKRLNDNDNQMDEYDIINLDDDDNDYVDEAGVLIDDYKQYYDYITSIVLNEVDEAPGDDDLFETVLNDLRTNTKLQPVLPYLLNFFSQSIQQLTQFDEDANFIEYTTNIEYIKRILEAIRCVVINKWMFLAPKGYISKLLSCLLYTIMQPLKIDDSYSNDILIREISSFILSLFLRLYDKYLLNTVEHIKNDFFLMKLHDSETSLHTIYGILYSVICLGTNFVDTIHSDIIECACKLLQFDETTKRLSIYNAVLAVCLNCLVIHFKRKETKQEFDELSKLYKKVYNIFGDRFVNLIEIDTNVNNKNCNSQTKTVNLSDKFTKKSSLNYKFSINCNQNINAIPLISVFDDYKIVKAKKISIKLNKK